MVEIIENAKQIIDDARAVGDSLNLNLWYPGLDTNPIKRIQIGLMDVRSSDDIRVSYDYARNGWLIEQPSKSEWDSSDAVCDQCWVEVAFCEAWSQHMIKG